MHYLHAFPYRKVCHRDAIGTNFQTVDSETLLSARKPCDTHAQLLAAFAQAIA